MTLAELSKERRLYLKQNILVGRTVDGVSYGELADADRLVSDEELEQEFGATVFVDEDFPD